MKNLIDILLSDKNKNNIKNFLLKSKQEIGEYKEVGQILKKYSIGKKITFEEKQKVYKQFLDTLKISGGGIIFILPFGSFLLFIIIKLGKKYNINFLPSSWNNKKQ
jgi:hypothetical protein